MYKTREAWSVEVAVFIHYITTSVGLLIDGVRIVTSLSTIPPSHMPNCKIREIGRVTRDLKVSLTIVRSLSVEGIFAVS